MNDNMLKYALLLISVVVIMFLSSGCYTVLRPTEEIPSGQEQYGEDEGYNEYYGYSHYYYPGYWSLYPRWGHYYATPWWWEYEYYNDGNEYDADGSPRSSHGQKANRIDAGWQPNSGSGTTSITRGSSSSSSSSSGSASSSAKEKTTKSDSGETETKTKDEKQDDGKSQSTTGGWRKK
nr:hypothetical protein [candidate division Zixibacteria bacterium]